MAKACDKIRNLRTHTHTLTWHPEHDPGRHHRRHKCFMHFSFLWHRRHQCQHKWDANERKSHILTAMNATRARTFVIILFTIFSFVVADALVCWLFVRRTHFSNNDDDDEKISNQSPCMWNPVDGCRSYISRLYRSRIYACFVCKANKTYAEVRHHPNG